MKVFKSLEEQLEYLKENKKILFYDSTSAQNYLLLHNYYNVVSCGKVKFARSFTEKKHEYQEKNFSEWQEYYELDLRVSKKVISKILELEKEINSKLAYYLSEMIEYEQLTLGLKEEVKGILNKEISNGRKDYDFQETWVYVTKSTFGTVVKLLDILDKDTQEKICPKSYNLKMIKELKNLRNNLFHLTPLNVYLTTNERTNHQNKLRRVQLLRKLLPNDVELGEIIKNANRFNKMKKEKPA
ncbi:Abi-like protein [Pilibacter termitis]|jgi:hypothetical protein|uniref:Abi-like protein n=1 Tax=Pilibacter termitis TaxID=263852 RepID=A0A1T4MGE5_9ENTE|nr:Abi family protein [Pilibacter termitis]SJZ65848.1 Abi-like protein [Pilibacter termitis]